MKRKMNYEKYKKLRATILTPKDIARKTCQTCGNIRELDKPCATGRHCEDCGAALPKKLTCPKCNGDLEYYVGKYWWWFFGSCWRCTICKRKWTDLIDAF